MKGATTFAAVITSYNYRDYVLEAVQSVLTQSRPATQIIVVDDGSTDGSDVLLREHFAADPRVTLICSVNGGQLAAFQQGVAAVTDAEVICFLDSDDRWTPDYLAKLAALYEARADVDFVFSDMQQFGERNEVMKFHPAAVDLGYTAISTYVLTPWYGAPTSALSMRANWARRAVDLPEVFRNAWRLCADNCLVYGTSVLGAYKYYLPTGCVDYRIHGKNGWSSNRSPTQAYQNLLRSRRLIGYYAQVAGLDDSSCRIELCKLEYKTKPQPPWFETKRYLRMIMMRRVSPPWRKWERALSVLARGWRFRK